MEVIAVGMFVVLMLVAGPVGAFAGSALAQAGDRRRADGDTRAAF